MKRCYYEILEVDRKSTPAEIKTSYRKLALKYHPDKNSEADAKQRFVEINEAYNVLSDPNERTWYDNNRDKVLFNKEEMSKEDLEQYSFGFNIWAYFTMACFSGYEDDEKGFYAVYRDAFEKIKAEETKAFVSREDITEQQRKFEGFGNAQTVEEKVLKFYEDWENFTTYKSFVWIEEWDTRDANSRWVRREMEKENKKQRQGEKKTFLKTVKDLVSYVKKRDPRFREYVVKQKQEEERKNLERLEREKEKKKEKEEMKVVKQRLEEERFKEIEEYYKRQSQQTQQTASRPVHDDDDEDCQFFCEACEKGFKSQNTLRNHQKSKQHKQMIKDIQREVLLREERMKKAEMEEAVPQVKVPEPEEQPQESPKKKNKKKKKKNAAQQQEEDKDDQEDEQPTPVPPPKPKAQPAKQPEKVKVQPKKEERSSSSDDDDRFMSTLLNNRNKKVQTKDAKVESKTATQVKKQDKKKKEAAKAKVDSEESQQQEGGEQQQRLNKAKLKKQKKAEQQKQKANTGPKCNVCNSVFSSKTKLFEHITKTGHASTK